MVSPVLNGIKWVTERLEEVSLPPKKSLSIGILTCLTVISLAYFDYHLSHFFSQTHLKNLRTLCRIISGAIAPLLHLTLWPTLFVLMSALNRRIHIMTLRLSLHILSVNALVTILKVLIGRPRPRYLPIASFSDWQFFTLSGNFHSFPSRHSANIILIALFFALYGSKKRYIYILTAFILSLARVPIHSHFLSDVIGGALTALLSYSLLEGTLNKMRHYVRNRSSP